MSRPLASEVTGAFQRFIGAIARVCRGQLRRFLGLRPKSGAANLPDDICLQIFELLREDRETLLACCLACRHWAAFLAPKHFYAINLRMKADHKILREFLAIRLSVCVRDLSMTFHLDYVPPPNLAATRPVTELTRSLFKSVSNSICALCSIRDSYIIRLPASEQGPEIDIDCGISLPSVQTLSLLDSRIADPEGLVTLLSAFPGLQECRLDFAVAPMRPGPISPLFPRVVSKLTSLSLSVTDSTTWQELNSRWACLLAALCVLELPALDRLQIEVVTYPIYHDGIARVPCEALDKQLVRLHRRCPRLTLRFRFLACFLVGADRDSLESISTSPSFTARNNAARIPQRLPLLRARAARAFYQEDLQLNLIVFPGQSRPLFAHGDGEATQNAI